MARGAESLQYRWSFRSTLKKIGRAGWRPPSPSGWSRMAAKSGWSRAKADGLPRGSALSSLAAADAGVASGRGVGQEMIDRRAQFRSLARQLLGGGQHQIGRAVGILARRGGARDALRDARGAGGGLADIFRYFDRRGILLVHGARDRRGKAVDIRHDGGDGADVVHGT